MLQQDHLGHENIGDTEHTKDKSIVNVKTTDMSFTVTRHILH